MTHIVITKKNGQIKSVECDGHTGYGVEGEDIVCSALSSVVQTAVLGLLLVEEIRLFYESNKSSFVWNDMMKMFIVLVPKGNNPEAARLKTNDLLNKFVSKKVTVEQLSVQSQAEGSGFQAGEMILPKTEASAAGIGMPYANLLKVFAQDEGYVSELQETKDDFRFISVSKKYAAKILAISDIVQPDTTVTVYDYIRANLTQQKQMVFVQQAAQKLADDLNKPEYVEAKKTGAALDKLLEWGD